MSTFRNSIKKMIPMALFRRIEPIGHLAEAVLFTTLYGFPGRRLKVIGVTGTNGKTTTSFMIHRMLHESGMKVALLTTVADGIGLDLVSKQEHMTTAKSSQIQKSLKKFAKAGVEWVVLETSSHSLAQHRVFGVPYEIAVMTNVTYDHLDYHGTFERYTQAKQRLFTLANKHGLRFGIANADDPQCEGFTSKIAHYSTYGIQSGQLRAMNIDLQSSKTTYTASIGSDTYEIQVNIPGEFNVSNSLAAVSVGRVLGLSTQAIESGIAALQSVEGRMTIVDEGQPFKVIIDFASTPDAFTNFFESIRPLTKGKLIAVFGSAGRRDEAKRSIQGKIAAKFADVVIATEEDDRDVDGGTILQQIATGAKKQGMVEGQNLHLVPNREDAIGYAFTLATSPNDVVVLLGKGHEKTIERANGENPWNETEVARAALQALTTEGANR